MSTELLVLYQKEIEEGLALVKTQKIPAGDWRAAEEQLKVCANNLRLMEEETRAARNASKKDITMVTINSLRKEIDSLMSDVKKSSLLNRSRIASEDDPETGGLLDDEDERAILSSSQSALDKSRKNLIEMQEVGTDIQSNLEQQTHTIKGVIKKVRTTDKLASESRNILRGIERAELRNKFCAYGAVILVFIGIVIALYWIMFRTGDSTTSS